MNKRLQQRLSTEIAKSEGDRPYLQVRRGDGAEAREYLKSFQHEAQSVLAGLPLTNPLHLEVPSKGQIEVVEGPLVDMGRHLGDWLEVGIHPYEAVPGQHISQKDLEGLIRRTVRDKSEVFSIRDEDTPRRVPLGSRLVIRSRTHLETPAMSTDTLSATQESNSDKTLEITAKKEVSVWEFMSYFRFQLLSAKLNPKN